MKKLVLLLLLLSISGCTSFFVKPAVEEKPVWAPTQEIPKFKSGFTLAQEKLQNYIKDFNKGLHIFMDKDWESK